ncbi:Cytochrome b-c1 complex subunit 9 [Yarrowia sp. C11]|nr:Cytochrome b-c1 complex subunit 9 [Yarrowia sp. E02]KAG5371663.1 Cytochrome b-c1 complex subunit 9 [Yarrowia sp. C11]
MAWATTFYNVFVKRNSAFVATILASAFVFDMTFETAIDNVWDRLNAGKQWKDIRYKYVEAAGDDEDDE